MVCSGNGGEGQGVTVHGQVGHSDPDVICVNIK